MSLSRHSSSFALTSSNRGSMNERERFPEKSWIGEISSRISSSPLGVGSACRSLQDFAPTSHSKDSVCRARRFGTSSGSRNFAKETLFVVPPEVEVMFLGVLVTAKMRPSKDKRRRSTVLTAVVLLPSPYAQAPATDTDRVPMTLLMGPPDRRL